MTDPMPTIIALSTALSHLGDRARQRALKAVYDWVGSHSERHPDREPVAGNVASLKDAFDGMFESVRSVKPEALPGVEIVQEEAETAWKTALFDFVGSSEGDYTVEPTAAQVLFAATRGDAWPDFRLSQTPILRWSRMLKSGVEQPGKKGWQTVPALCGLGFRTELLEPSARETLTSICGEESDLTKWLDKVEPPETPPRFDDATLIVLGSETGTAAKWETVAGERVIALTNAELRSLESSRLEERLAKVNDLLRIRNVVVELPGDLSEAEQASAKRPAEWLDLQGSVLEIARQYVPDDRFVYLGPSGFSPPQQSARVLTASRGLMQLLLDLRRTSAP